MNNKKLLFVKDKYYNEILYYILDLLYLCLINNNNNKKITLLIKKNINNTSMYNNAADSLLHIIISNEYEKHIRKNKNLNNNNKNYTVNQYEIKSLLLKYLVLDCNANVNYKNLYGLTPLFMAVKYLKLDLLELLVLELGAHVDQNIFLDFSCSIHKGYETSCYEIIMNNVSCDCCCKNRNGNNELEKFSSEIRMLFNNELRLKCLTAKFIKVYFYRYKKEILKLNNSIQNFIEIH